MALFKLSKQRIILIVGIILAIISIFMINAYLNQQRQAMQEQAKKTLADIQANQTAVLVAQKDIPIGTIIDAQMLETAVVPNKYVQPQTATSLDRIAGMRTIAPITKGEQMSLTKLIAAQKAGRGGLAEATPIGKRAITISVDNITGLAGLIKPGNYVDVIAMVTVPMQTPEGKPTTQIITLPIFQNVLVLAVGQQTAVLPLEAEGRYKKEEKTEVASLITLGLTPQEANLIAFVQEQAKIRLVLRSPADANIQPVQPANWDALFQYAMPKEQVTPLSKEELEPVEYVEIYRGLNKEKIPLSK